MRECFNMPTTPIIECCSIEVPGSQDLYAKTSNLQPNPEQHCKRSEPIHRAGHANGHGVVSYASRLRLVRHCAGHNHIHHHHARRWNGRCISNHATEGIQHHWRRTASRGVGVWNFGNRVHVGHGVARSIFVSPRCHQRAWLDFVLQRCGFCNF